MPEYEITPGHLMRTVVRCLLMVAVLVALGYLVVIRARFHPDDASLTTPVLAQRIGFPEQAASPETTTPDSPERSSPEGRPKESTQADPDENGVDVENPDEQSDPDEPDPIDWKNTPITKPVPGLRVVVFLSRRTMGLLKNREYIRAYYHIAYARDTAAPKTTRNDNRAPQGTYRILGYKSKGGAAALLLDYPNAADAARALQSGVIDQATHDRIAAAHQAGAAPPWDTSLGGPLYITGDREKRGVTGGDISIRQKDMQELWVAVKKGTLVQIVK